MYFDVDSTVEIPESRLEAAFAFAAREISLRRGSVIAMTRDILLFSAPFWRVNGLFYFFVRQLPLGVSQGIFDVTSKDGVSTVRVRISLLWLRLCIAMIVLLLMPSVIAPGAGDKFVLWTLFLLSIFGGGIIYIVAIIETRKYFLKMLLEV